MAFKERFEIGSRLVGRDCPTFLIAEIGRNHNQDLALAKDSIHAAAKAGADAVKFQSFTAATLVRNDLENVDHVAETGGGKSIYQLTREAELPPAWHGELQAFATAQGVTFLSTPEDPSMVDLLADLPVPAFKIASLDIRYHDLIRRIAATRRPVVLSTGMATMGEVETALDVLSQAGVDELALLHCVSNYPPRDEDLNLRAMQTLHQAFQVPVGFSDHSMGIGASIAAVALGACVIERHFTLDRELPGTDHRMSLEPEEFARMATEIRSVEKALGSPIKRPVEAEQEMRRLHRRRLVAARPVSAGTPLTRDDVACKCSDAGLEPDRLDDVIGCRLRTELAEDTPITADILE